jgi:hypothetical protein
VGYRTRIVLKKAERYYENAQVGRSEGRSVLVPHHDHIGVGLAQTFDAQAPPV